MDATLEKSPMPLSIEDIAHEIGFKRPYNQSVYVKIPLERMVERCDVVKISKSEDTKIIIRLLVTTK